ncbi:MAG: hypothetical protein AB1757_05065 [Acidobacteriota bacterium]
MSIGKEKLAQSVGKCNLCGDRFNKRVMSRHLQSCLKNVVTANKKASPTKTFHIAVEGKYLPEYWLHLEIRADATLDDLDEFLRDLWLECCGHLSAFTIDGIRYDKIEDDFDLGFGFEKSASMNIEIGKVFAKGAKIDYEYDFGTTTDLTLKVIQEREGNLSKREAIRILARNDEPMIPCYFCGAPAKAVCSYCVYDREGWLCKKCKRKHEHYDDDVFLPVLNSPRTGQCGYEG